MNFFESLKSPNVGPWLFTLLFLLIIVLFNVFSQLKKKGTKKQKDDQKKIKEKVAEDKPKAEPKPKRSWSFNPFKSITWDNVLVRLIVPGLIIIGGWLVYTRRIKFSGGEIIWLIIIGLALVIFATRSNWFRKVVMFGGSGVLIGLMIYGLTTMNLGGTPWPIKVQAANIWVDYDVSEPRWTMISFNAPDNCNLEITADGTYWWDTLDSRGPCDPNGMFFNGRYIPTKEIKQPQHFIDSLWNDPFAGLIAKVGDGCPFFVGKHCTRYIKKGGPLYFSINIRWVRPGSMAGYTGPDSWKKNWKNAKGKVHIDISIKPPSG